MSQMKNKKESVCSVCCLPSSKVCGKCKVYIYKFTHTHTHTHTPAFSGLQSRKYCSRGCQKDDWAQHRTLCDRTGGWNGLRKGLGSDLPVARGKFTSNSSKIATRKHFSGLRSRFRGRKTDMWKEMMWHIWLFDVEHESDVADKLPWPLLRIVWEYGTGHLYDDVQDKQRVVWEYGKGHLYGDVQDISSDNDVQGTSRQPSFIPAA
mmetsp:Transcript_17653/g.34475  ORF Transcript_17653/g.34475 Transcript_17653/m.34475 type:complete len:206 (-) Transcript_17653:70-687(-)